MGLLRNKRETNANDSYDPGWDEVRLRRRRRRRILGVLVALPLLLIALAPTIVAKSPLRDIVLKRLIPADAGRIECRTASFGWITGQSLDAVQLIDAQGATLLTAESVGVDRSLWQLLASQASLGRIYLQRPLLHLQSQADSTNVEDFVAQLMTDEKSDLPSMQIVVVDGAIQASDSSGQQWRASKVMVDVATDGGSWRGAASADVAEADPQATNGLHAQANGSAGVIKANLTPKGEATQLTCSAADLPLVVLQIWIGRSVPGAKLGGACTVDLTGSLSGGQQSPRGVEASLELSEMQLQADALLNDVLRINQGVANVHADVAEGRLTLSRFDASGEWFRASGQGGFSLAGLDENQSALANSDGTFDCDFDLAKLAAMLPQTLRLRPAVRVDAGSARATIQSQRRDELNGWKCGLSLSDVRGRDGQRQISWREPVELSALIAADDRGARLQQASLTATFANANLEPVTNGYRGQAEFDLERLAEQLGQFVDLTDWRLRGGGSGVFEMQATAADVVHTMADVRIDGVDVRHAGEVFWRDPQLVVQFDAIGNGTPDNLTEITSAFMEVTDSTGSARIELLQPADLSSKVQNLYLRVDGSGAVSNWATKLRPFGIRLPDDVDGRASIAARVKYAPQSIELVSMRLLADDLKIQTDGLHVDESRIEVTGDLQWDAGQRTFQANRIDINSNTIAASGSELFATLSEQGVPAVSGEIAFTANLQRLATTLDAGGRSDNLVPAGQAVGRVHLLGTAEGTVAGINFTARPLQLTRQVTSSGTNEVRTILAWSEPKLEGSARLRYRQAEDRLEFSNVAASGVTLQFTGDAAVERLSQDAALSGEFDVSYDENSAAQFIASFLGPGVRVTGLNSAKIKVDGMFGNTADAPDQPPTPPHWSRRWKLAGATAWTSVDVFGLSLGPTRVVGLVDDGKLRLQQLTIPVGDGSLSIQSRVLLDPSPGELQFAAGPLASRLNITREVVDNAMKYAAPMLAGAAQAEGTFSFDFERTGARIPLSDPRRTDARGKLTIHEMTISPGLIVQQLGQTLRQVEALARRNLLGANSAARVRTLTATDRVVEVAVTQGRVYHREFEFLVDDVPVRSTGSVGFDETLDILIEFPIPEKWFGDQQLRRLLAGQVVQIPIRGRMDAPQIDSQAALERIVQIGQQAAGRAVEDAINNELNRALDRLLQPR